MNIRKEANNIVCRVFVKKNYSDKLLNQTVKKIKNSQRDKNLLYSLVKGTIKMYKTLEYTALQFVDPIKFKKTPIKVKTQQNKFQTNPRIPVQKQIQINSQEEK